MSNMWEDQTDSDVQRNDKRDWVKSQRLERVWSNDGSFIVSSSILVSAVYVEFTDEDRGGQSLRAASRSDELCRSSQIPPGTRRRLVRLLWALNVEEIDGRGQCDHCDLSTEVEQPQPLDGID